MNEKNVPDIAKYNIRDDILIVVPPIFISAANCAAGISF